MVSRDHYRHELSALIGRAEGHSMISVLVNSVELSESLRGFSQSPTMKEDCIGAMRDEMALGDRIVLTEKSFSGLTVRYFLPRAKQAPAHHSKTR